VSPGPGSSGRPPAGAGPGSLEEFKARLPLAEIVGRWVKLTRRGREWTGLCPFHKERTPSFSVVEDKGFYHCFGCGAHGGALDFVMAVERLEFREAIERLSELTGIPAPRRAGPEAPRADPSLYDVNAAAAVWYAARLADPEAAPARAYLERRGLDRATVQGFRLGWAPGDRTALRRALEEQGFATAQLVAAGLLRLPEGGGEPYALLRERVTFPIADGKGRIVGFGGRTLGDGQPKYLNTPDTELFHKGRLLYGLDRAAEPARRQRRLVVAEGYMDVIALVRAGVPAVAPLGTAMGEEQLQACWKLVETPTVCLDGDAAGLKAALRLAERAAPLLRPDRSLGFVVLPEGEDPDSLVRSQGPAALEALLARPEPLAGFAFRLLRARGSARLEGMEERARLRTALRALVARVEDPDVRASLEEDLRARLEAELARLGLARPGAGRPGFDRRGAPRGAPPGGRPGPPGPTPARLVATSELLSGLGRLEAWREAPLLAPVLEAPELLAEVEDELAELALDNPVLERLRQEILGLWAERHHLDATELAAHLARCGLAEPVARVRSASGTGGEPGAEAGSGSPLERWRAAVARRRRRLDREREVDALAARADVARAERPLGGLDRLLNARDEDAAGEPRELPSDRPDP
jgi:DNA primase